MADTKAGDLVKITTKDGVFEGILMPRPDVLEKDITVIKLDNGYNIGINNKKIKKVELVKKYSPKKASKSELKPKKGLPNVTILSTGGTISSKIDYKTGGVYADYTAEDFVSMCPELVEIANLKAKKILSVMSEDMNGKDWVLIAKEVEKELNSGADGVVVTQGTDTLHFTSAALSFLLKDLSKPVVLTAAQRSIDRGSSDAFMNLICAVTAAAKFDGAEVMTCMHGTTSDDYCLLIRGTNVRKMHTSKRDAFRPMNELPLAKVFENGKIEVVNQNFMKRGKSKVKAIDKFEEKVALINVYPGMDPEIVDFYVKKGVKGIVLSATALGHAPQKLYPNIEKAIKAKIPIVIASQTLYGRVHPLVYSALRILSIKLKCIFVEDMLPEVAYVKLGFVLSQTKDLDKVKELMLTNVSGEITERSDEKSFLY
ncbi:Glu-tRNA(Gln) amidotransferase GatDE subunit D [Candidatus Woesearchaeota archaeon B3_Woes]|nr:MAG: Glu-tRNA(Gln) amidotransferase GatDE subunit D [Candidatus Woesearchaeota archaeon B3_Woes]